MIKCCQILLSISTCAATPSLTVQGAATNFTVLNNGSAALGRAVQVEPIKPKLKPPGAERLKLKCDILLTIFAFKFNLRRYTWACWRTRRSITSATARWGGAG